MDSNLFNHLEYGLAALSILCFAIGATGALYHWRWNKRVQG